MSQNSYKKELEQDLIGLGLSLKEARVYLSLLSQGVVGTGKIIKDTEMHGQVVYRSLDKLVKKGLVQYTIVRGRKKFTAKDPAILVQLAEKQKSTAEDLSKKILQTFSLAEEQRVKIYEGRDAFIFDQMSSMKEMPENSQMLIIGTANKHFIPAMGNMYKELEYIRAKRNIEIKYIGSEAEKEVLAEFQERAPIFNVRTLPGDFLGQVNTVIYPDALTYVILTDPPYSIRVENKQIAEDYTKFFETLWKLGS